MIKKISMFLKQIPELFDFQKLVDIFRHPEFHAREIPLLLALVSICTLTLVVFYYLSLLRKLEHIPEEEKSFRKSAYYFALFIGLTLLALYIPTVYLSSARSCLQCHSKYDNHDYLLETAHQNVDCRDCHLKMGISGRLESFFALMGKVTLINFTNRPPARFSCCVSSNNCLACHRYVLYETVNSNYIKVSHRELFSMYKDCLTCHDFSQEKNPYFSLLIMKKCQQCHDGVRVSAKCETCHSLVGSPSKIKPNLSDYPKVTIKGENPVDENAEPSPTVNVTQF
jgi:hypothetical protein